MTSTGNCVIGRARTVLVTHAGAQPVACVTTVLARLRRRGRSGRLVTAGPVRFASSTKQHLEEVVLAAVDRIAGPLQNGGRRFELSIVNVAAASVHDLDLEVEGYSLDTAAALAMLSAALRLPVRQDVVSTGQVASIDGDVRPVRGIPEKLQAACTTSEITRFLFPSLDQDGSLDSLAPDTRKTIVDALADAGADIRVIEIRDLADLLYHATTEVGRVNAALRAGYFHCEPNVHAKGTEVLVHGLEECFWQCVERDLFEGRPAQARRLLELRARAELNRGIYPAGFGSRLHTLLCSVPPAIRRRRGFLPLLPSGLCFQLGALASDSDQQDATRLLSAAGQLSPSPSTPRQPLNTSIRTNSADESVQATLEAISAEQLAQEVGRPADDARAGFVLPGVIIEDYDEFNDTITAFHLALLRHTDAGNPCPQPHEALSLLERAYSDAGGMAAARAEAKFAVEGGMRAVLDRLTEQYKNEQRFKRVNRILAEALDPLDWANQVEFTRALLERLRPQLPDSLRDADPARFVRRREEIVRAYVNALDRVHSVIRRM